MLDAARGKDGGKGLLGTKSLNRSAQQRLPCPLLEIGVGEPELPARFADDPVEELTQRPSLERERDGQSVRPCPLRTRGRRRTNRVPIRGGIGGKSFAWLWHRVARIQPAGYDSRPSRPRGSLTSGEAGMALGDAWRDPTTGDAPGIPPSSAPRMATSCPRALASVLSDRPRPARRSS